MHDYDDLAARYVSTWNDTDPEGRRAAIAKLWAADGRYSDPLGAVAGHAGIDATIAEVQSRFPGWRFQLTGHVDGHHDQCRFGWELGPPGGEAPVAGFDVAVIAHDGRLQTVLGFLDRVPTA